MLLAALVGCDQRPAGDANALQSSSSAAQRPVLHPDMDDWSLAEAVQRLSDRQGGVSAAVRLIRLAGVAPTVVPDPLGRDEALALRLAPLSADLYALGVWETGRREHLWGPVLVDAAGAVTLVGERLDNLDAVLLRISPDVDLFPHLMVASDEVWLASRPDSAALCLQDAERVRFALASAGDYPYVQLVLRAAPEVEVARYRWDPYELMFLGPARDTLPAEAGGGEFAIDLERSEALVPMGGIIPKLELPEADPNAPPAPAGIDLGTPM